jgi:hypothetical protein
MPPRGPNPSRRDRRGFRQGFVEGPSGLRGNLFRSARRSPDRPRAADLGGSLHEALPGGPRRRHGRRGGQAGALRHRVGRRHGGGRRAMGTFASLRPIRVTEGRGSKLPPCATATASPRACSEAPSAKYGDDELRRRAPVSIADHAHRSGATPASAIGPRCRSVLPLGRPGALPSAGARPPGRRRPGTIATRPWRGNPGTSGGRTSTRG